MRTMGDAIHDQVPQLAAARFDLYAGYTTGTAAIQWTASDWARFPAASHVTIDQGFGSPMFTTSTVRDVETGAWTVNAAVNLTNWRATRRTIYCSASLLTTLEAAGWAGDVWVADYVSYTPAQPYPVPAGMRCVAWQYTDTGGGGAYDQSIVFDPAWPQTAADPPKEDDMLLIKTATSPAVYLLSGSRIHDIQDGGSLSAYQAAGLQLAIVSAAEMTRLLTDYGPVTVTVPPVTVTVPNMSLAGTITPA